MRRSDRQDPFARSLFREVDAQLRVIGDRLARGIVVDLKDYAAALAQQLGAALTPWRGLVAGLISDEQFTPVDFALARVAGRAFLARRHIQLAGLDVGDEA